MKKFKKLLIVDDEPTIRESLSLGLESYGWKSSGAKTAGEALEFDTQFDAYIIDLSLPDSDGLFLTQSLKRKFHDARVVVFSGYLNDEIRRAAESVQVDAVVKKPFRLEEVNRILQGVVKKKSDSEEG